MALGFFLLRSLLRAEHAPQQQQQQQWRHPRRAVVDDDDDGARSVSQSVSQSAEERLDLFLGSIVVGGLASLALQLLVRSRLQELFDDLDSAIPSRYHEGCESIILLLVHICPCCEEEYHDGRILSATRYMKTDLARRILQGQEVDE